MKPLLHKTTGPFLIYVLIILIISIPVYYLVIDQIWKAELDEHNKTIAQKTAYEFNHLRLNDKELLASINLWKRIQPETDIRELRGNSLQPDIYTTIEKTKPFDPDQEIERYRCLQTIVYLNNKPFLFTIQTNIEETEETVAVIGLITAFFFIIIVSGLLILNRRLSKSIWRPFRSTLEKLRHFNLYHHDNLSFEKADILEFEELHQSLRVLITQNVSAFKAQKEFTENASHELQTPLAIMKQKLDLLLQSEDLTDMQYDIVEAVHKALLRSSRINKNLLLLAKIDNSQFSKSEDIPLIVLVQQSLELLDEHFREKDLSIYLDVSAKIHTTGNVDLTEILINNLLINAIRYTPSHGNVSVILNERVLEITNSGDRALDQHFLFKRFQGSNARGGTGLGLAIVKEICIYQNWTIDYRFEKGNHIFTITHKF
ncbi:sensor histidine kinase [Chryseobacterium takakiae]|uniref:histidine kinase n=1 Tax=Chryseobacterium takakiae TaxID=1302685 RepID=A0A1M5ATU6_9FLAO|nr:HAMP domain-containing sensor histidine kinase [Chryseobacterium takakiae]SHF33625.1 Signal transduction histidine kinase [Chryseobacterium takakiae]